MSSSAKNVLSNADIPVMSASCLEIYSISVSEKQCRPRLYLTRNNFVKERGNATRSMLHAIRNKIIILNLCHDSTKFMTYYSVFTVTSTIYIIKTFLSVRSDFCLPYLNTFLMPKRAKNLLNWLLKK